ncbi:hypothetical protein T492DRAFT_174352 [Pavlovales sp. CCMP2436]|nr:hypothetical protein T492DRAFT_174352 [Pavlovales sp. CCMP2436]
MELGAKGGGADECSLSRGVHRLLATSSEPTQPTNEALPLPLRLSPERPHTVQAVRYALQPAPIALGVSGIDERRTIGTRAGGGRFRSPPHMHAARPPFLNCSSPPSPPFRPLASNFSNLDESLDGVREGGDGGVAGGGEEGGQGGGQVRFASLRDASGWSLGLFYYSSTARRKISKLCGWPLADDAAQFERFVCAAEAESDYERAALVSFLHGDLARAVSAFLIIVLLSSPDLQPEGVRACLGCYIIFCSAFEPY